MFNELRSIYSRSHVVIVPTTSEFMEGFNMVAVEAVLAGRPVITSDVCPAVHYLGGAAVKVPVDDIDAYQAAVERMADDPAYYRRSHEACALVGERFFDKTFSFGEALRSVLAAANSSEDPEPREVPRRE